MDVTPLVPAGRRIIESYGSGGFRISSVRHQGSVIVMPQSILAWTAIVWSEETSLPLTEILAEMGVPALDVLLIGTGNRMVPLSARFRGELRQRGMAVEAMDTGAACRTYNVLLAEGRLVAAALIAVD